MPRIAHPRSSNRLIFNAFSWDYHGIQSNWHSEVKSKQSSTGFRRGQYNPKVQRYLWTDLCSVTLTSHCTTQNFRDCSAVFISSCMLSLSPFFINCWDKVGITENKQTNTKEWGGGGNLSILVGNIKREEKWDPTEKAGVTIDSSLPHLMAVDDDILSTGVVLYHLRVRYGHLSYFTR